MSTLLPPEHAKAMAAFDHVQRTRLVFGNGSAGRVGALSAELGLRRILLVTDPGIVAPGMPPLFRRRSSPPGWRWSCSIQ